MGYTTEFEGKIAITPALSAAEVAFLKAFSDTRHMEHKLGPYHVGDIRERDITSYNATGEGKPGLWCQWIPTEDGQYLEWDGNEKFYDSVEWMQYLIDHFLAPNAHAAGIVPGIVGGHILNGILHAQGEEPDDTWYLVVVNNKAEHHLNTPSAHTMIEISAASRKNDTPKNP